MPQGCFAYEEHGAEGEYHRVPIEEIKPNCERPLTVEWGVNALKFGFVNTGPQKWTAWLMDAVRKCAEYGIVVNIHDAYRATGFSRTYPNLLTQEGIRGNEHMPTARHNTTLPFTRFVAGAGSFR